MFQFTTRLVIIDDVDKLAVKLIKITIPVPFKDRQCHLD